MSHHQGDKPAPPKMSRPDSSDEFARGTGTYDFLKFEIPMQFDVQALEERFNRFGVSNPPNRQEPVLDHRRDNNKHNNQIHMAVNGQGNSHPPPFDRELSPLDYRPASYASGANQKYDSLYKGGPYYPGSIGGEVPFTPRNPYPDKSPLGRYHAYCMPMPGGIRNGGAGGGIYDAYVPYGPDANARNRSSVLWRAKDRVESKKLQDMIMDAPREVIDEIFNDVISDVCQLMVDSLGYHVFEKLLPKLTNDQITRVLDKVIENPIQFARTCGDSHGTHAVQDLMRSLRGEDQIERFMNTLSHVALTLTKSNNANYVLMLCFNHFTPAQIRGLVQVLVNNCYQIAIDQHGCCMFQQCIGKSSGEQRELLIGGVIVNALRLCVNCYGNYVVQYVLELDDAEMAAALSRQLLGHFVHLSLDKYGSHAVQKCLRHRDFGARRHIINELLTDIDLLLVDPYGNYVIQTVWEVSQEDVRNILYYHISMNAQLMRCNRYGRKVLEKLRMY